MKIEISQPSTAAEFNAYYDFRWRELRAPLHQPRGSEKDEHDGDACHVLARVETGELLGIGRIHRTADGNAQIRYMATREGHRGQGIGKAIVTRLEQSAREFGAQRIILNARLNAVPFYETLGYKVAGDGPTLFGTLEHKRMHKQL